MANPLALPEESEVQERRVGVEVAVSGGAATQFSWSCLGFAHGHMLIMLEDSFQKNHFAHVKINRVCHCVTSSMPFVL